MSHHLFFLCIIKANCECAHLNWKKAINLIIRLQNVGGVSYYILSLLYFEGLFFLHTPTTHHSSWTKAQSKTAQTRTLSYYEVLPFSWRRHYH